MSAKFFLDTNIFVYSLDVTAPAKAERSAELIREGIETRQGIVSYQVVQEFFNVESKRLVASMSIEAAQLYLERVFLPLLRVHSSAALYGEALAFQGRYRLSWYDSLIICSALHAECTILYSEDLQHNQKFGKLRIVNPFL